jgi:hypothetical protein
MNISREATTKLREIRLIMKEGITTYTFLLKARSRKDKRETTLKKKANFLLPHLFRISGTQNITKILKSEAITYIIPIE